MLRKKYILMAACWLCLGVSVAGSDLKLPAILGDHMVLQQNTTVNIWGWAAPGSSVEVVTSWDGKSYSATAEQDGNWLVKAQTLVAGGPYTVTVASDTTLMLSDVMLGEVWVCSGQSNMEFPLARAESARPEIPQANHPDIRLFTVEKRIASRPREDVHGSWKVSSPATARDFSAVGYFFGKHLNGELGIPVGMINTSWGGTPSEAWTSREMLRTFGDFDYQLDRLYGLTDEELDKAEAQRDSLAEAKALQMDFANTQNVGLREGWMMPGYDDNSWTEAACPAEWSTMEGFGMIEGVVWLRKRFEIPAGWIGKSLVLELGPIDEMDVTYLNGHEVGAMKEVADWTRERIYHVPGSLIDRKEIVLAIRIVNTIREGGLYGEPGQLRIYPQSGGGTDTVKLAGNWKYRVAYRFPEIPQLANPNTPSVLFNGMLSPLTRYVIRGAIWYQGEANVDRAMQYREIFPGMITDWRDRWGIGDFPFYFVQLAPYRYGNDPAGAELREAQFMTLSRLDNTGMAVTLDIGNPEDIHPANKRDVGKRLALWALARDYGKDPVYSGPLYSGMTIEGSAIRVAFEHTGKGLQSVGGPPTHFEIAGQDRVYHPARAVIDGHTVLVTHPDVKSPVAVRYGWSNTAEPNLYNWEGLPASSFCSDNWPRVTEGKR
jgi:sialate O-acetylesterase